MSDVEGETEKILTGPSLQALLSLWEKATGPRYVAFDPAAGN